MKIAAAALHRYCLPLRAGWLTAAGTLTQRRGWLLRLDTDDGARAYGDCAPLPTSGTETPAEAESALRAQARRLIGRQGGDALAALDKPPRLRAPAARCAIEMALLDLLSQHAGRPLAAYLQGSRQAAGPAPGWRAVPVNAALGSLGEVTDDAVLAACGECFRVLKLKVGVAAVAREIDRLRQIAGLLPAGVELRLDANRAWTAGAAERFLRSCGDLPIEMIEEPLAEPRLDQLQDLQASTPIAIAVDESAASLDLEQLLRTHTVRRLVIKPTRSGGLLPAITLARRAASAGLECIVTSSVDSACGVIAAGHLAAALDNRGVHGLATSAWLTRDTGVPPTITGGRLMLPDASGLGFSPGEEVVFADLDRC
ncbi:MAG: o-succinylbenzoate synthase [Candidatus Accumulibacter phosphatis]|uniref:o-succinylbenzoate synthase n=1 Tax=Candidatus Accumulibacter phosphatis TaxID=327160 RepID=UPI001A5B6CDB|nr:o-succinylbenzoate synthase [Candidatus Accumulibacter phosphatis]